MNRKNLLLIHVDQQRYDSLGFTGSKLVCTPNLDRLAAEGAAFRRAYTPCPLCCPARQSLLTSRMPYAHGGHWNYDNGSSVKGLDPNETPVWPQVLKEAGYTSIYGGKWHVNEHADPTCFGYDEYIRESGYADENLAPWFEDLAVDVPKTPAELFARGLYDTSRLEEAPTHSLAQQIIDRIEEQRALGKPWHARMDFFEPHLPCYPVRQFIELYDRDSLPLWENFTDPFENKPLIQQQQLRSWGVDEWDESRWAGYLALYFAMISQVDDAIGLVLKYLEEQQLLEDTLIIYTSDHGDAAGSHGMLDKHYVMYEEEIHVPLIIAGKGCIVPGNRDGFVVHALDLGVTILEMLGLQVPESFTGISLVPMLEDREATVRDHIFSEYNGQQFGLYTMRMVRDDRYAYIWNPTSIDELYDLREDPGQLVNRIDDPSCINILKDLRRLLLQDFAADPMTGSMWSRYQLTGALSGT